MKFQELHQLLLFWNVAVSKAVEEWLAKVDTILVTNPFYTS